MVSYGIVCDFGSNIISYVSGYYLIAVYWCYLVTLIPMQVCCLMVPRQCIGKPGMGVMKPIVVFVRHCDHHHHQSTLKSLSENVVIINGQSIACDMCNVTTYQSILLISRWLVRSGKNVPIAVQIWRLRFGVWRNMRASAASYGRWYLHHYPHPRPVNPLWRTTSHHRHHWGSLNSPTRDVVKTQDPN